MLKILSITAAALIVTSCANIAPSPPIPKNHTVLKDTTDNSHANRGLLTLKSVHSVKETADRFEKLAKNKGLTVFSRIDHQKNAQNAGLALAPTEVIIFGNPKAGTPLMQCAPSVAIDLPQKVLIYKDAEQRVWLSYNDPSYLKARHDIKGCDQVLDKIAALLSQLSKAATTQSPLSIDAP